jgi:hypothetical protein
METPPPKTTAESKMTNIGNKPFPEKSLPASSEQLINQNRTDLLISATPDALIVLGGFRAVLYQPPPGSEK